MWGLEGEGEGEIGVVGIFSPGVAAVPRGPLVRLALRLGHGLGSRRFTSVPSVISRSAEAKKRGGLDLVVVFCARGVTV